MSFLALRDLAVCMKTKGFFFFENRAFFIPDLYFYDIKIQTNIKQNLVKKHMRGNHKFFLKYFFEFVLDWAGPGPLILGWLEQVWPSDYCLLLILMDYKVILKRYS